MKVVDADAKNLYEAIRNVFVTNNIDYKNNLLGFAADGANVMSGCNNFVSVLLKKDCPDLFYIFI